MLYYIILYYIILYYIIFYYIILYMILPCCLIRSQICSKRIEVRP